MTIFISLISEASKAEGLHTSCSLVREGGFAGDIYEVSHERFRSVPGSPFCYWASDQMLVNFLSMKPTESAGFSARVGIQTSDDFRYLRLHWEPSEGSRDVEWFPYSKGGSYSPVYANLDLVARWGGDGREMKAWVESLYGGGQHWSRNLRSVDFSFREAITWPQRSQIGLSARVLPRGCLFGIKGPAVFEDANNEEQLLAMLALMQSTAFKRHIALQMAFGSFDVGVVQRTPVPDLKTEQRVQLVALARQAWALKRSLDTASETSHAFLLPLAIRQSKAEPLGAFDPSSVEAEIARIQAEIDYIAFALYGFSDADRVTALGSAGGAVSDGDAAEDADTDGDEEEANDDTPSTDALLSWAIGVAFGRFDVRLATGERDAPPEPEPFDPLPTKSPGMLPDGDASFHAHAGILVDDPGHAHDLVRIAERVLERVLMPVPADLRRWLQKDFFPFHLKRYSKSRRKAPIYWPLSTASGSYTLWLYYPSLTSQTLYTAINDFVEPKLVDVVKEAAGLKTKGSARNREEERRLEALTTLEAELTDLRDQLQAIAPRYRPNHDDGVQITAAPLWPLFRHKPWQKLLKDTWAKLQKGDYDWAHLAMNYWPERVREKCKTDKSLAIAHGLEDLYVEPEAAPKKARGRKKKEDAE